MEIKENKCSRCIHWIQSMHVGHNLGYCYIRKLIFSRYTPACNNFEDRGYDPPEVMYGVAYRAKNVNDV